MISEYKRAVRRKIKMKKIGKIISAAAVAGDGGCGCGYGCFGITYFYLLS
jgi:hypothetical protein